MPIKGQKMGSITHNSAEVNSRPASRGMLSKLKGSFKSAESKATSSGSKATSAGSKATAGSSGSKTTAGSFNTHATRGGGRKNGMAKSTPGVASSFNSQPPPANHQRQASHSFTHGDSTVDIPPELRESFQKTGIPTSITALVDAASCMTDEFEQPVPTMSRRPDGVSCLTGGNDFRPQAIDPHSSRMHSQGMMSYGTSDAASRALANLHVSGQQDNHMVSMSRNNSGEEGHNSADWARNNGGQNEIAPAVQNPGYNNYTYAKNYTEEDYEDDGAPDYYDNSGGGLFDADYMQSSRISVSAHQPPPPDRGYNRRSSNMEESYAIQSGDTRGGYASGAYNQPSFRGRPSNADDYPPENSQYYRGSSGSNGSYNNEMPLAYYRGSSDGDAYQAYTGLPLHPVHNPTKRNSIDNAACTPTTQHRRRATIDHDRRASRHNSVDYSSNKANVVKNNGRGGAIEAVGGTPSRRPNVQRSSSIRGSLKGGTNNSKRPTEAGASSNSESTEPAGRVQTIVNNNGRGETSCTISPNSQQTSGDRHRLSVTARNNPKWFAPEEINSKNSSSTKNSHNTNSECTEQHRNVDGRRISFTNSHKIIGGDDDDDRTMATMATMATKAQALRPQAMNKAKDMKYPEGDVTIVYTDVQGSTSMWEASPSDMKKATDVHDIIIRQCYTNHSGYEIGTEGDSFILAFQHPVDALAFALQAQLKLYSADWPEGILRASDGKVEPALKFRGFRVRFGLHHGPTTSRVHEMTGRKVYSGEAVKIARSVEEMCHGGQILTTMETWKAVSGMAERYLGRPQILDCGEHLLFETSDRGTTTRYTRRIMQLVPSDLAFDFFEARGRRDVPSAEEGKTTFEIKDASKINGRLFPPLKSKRQLTTCFLNAPYGNGRVTICFVYTVGLDDNPDNRASDLKVLAKYVRKQLLARSPPGYECQEDNGCWMLSFDRMAHAVTFGLELKSRLSAVQSDLVGNVNGAEGMFKVGILSGPFTSMGPHKTTGMADYFGPIVNRAARVASNCEPGEVCVGIPLSNGVTADPPDFGPTVNVTLQSIKKLKGITIDVAIFECSRRRIETPYR